MPPPALPEFDDTSGVCTFEAGTYTIGDNVLVESRPAHEVVLAAFSIRICAVSNAQFKEFVDAGGYQDGRWWTALGWRWQQGKQITAPAFWDDPNFNHPLQPVVGIGWYEALAYTRWFAAESGVAWRLPTEVEWEAATRVSVPYTRYINSAERGIGRPVAVWGVGEPDAGGVYHLLGNVWEWTSSRWGRNWQSLDYTYPYDPTDGRENLDGSYARVMRGGSWFDPLAQAKAGVRGRFLPGSRASNIGFRLAR